MTTNRRTEKKQHREPISVKSAELIPASSNGSQSPQMLVTPTDQGEQVHALMVEVESFLSKREELARKLTLEIEATEKRLEELKKIAASLFPEQTDNARPDRKAKKNKTKAANRDAKTDAPNTKDNPQSEESMI